MICGQQQSLLTDVACLTSRLPSAGCATPPSSIPFLNRDSTLCLIWQVESLIEQPTIISYWDQGPEKRAEIGIKAHSSQVCRSVFSAPSPSFHCRIIWFAFHAALRTMTISRETCWRPWTSCSYEPRTSFGRAHDEWRFMNARRTIYSGGDHHLSATMFIRRRRPWRWWALRMCGVRYVRVCRGCQSVTAQQHASR